MPTNLRITDIKELNKEEYEVIIDNNTYILVADTVLKYRLYKDKEIDNLAEIIEYNNKIKYLDKIRKYVSRYLKSKYNYYLYFSNKYEDIDITYILDYLEEIGLIDDKKYTNIKANSLISNGYSINYIKKYLIYKDHIDSSVVDEVLQNLDNTDSNIEKLILKLIRKYDKYDNKEKKDKIIKYLLRKGYNLEEFKDILINNLEV